MDMQIRTLMRTGTFILWWSKECHSSKTSIPALCNLPNAISTTSAGFETYRISSFFQFHFCKTAAGLHDDSDSKREDSSYHDDSDHSRGRIM